MQLSGIDFPNVWCAPGARNFEGSGWWYGRLAKLLPGYTWDNTGFVTKTSTLDQRDGNMPLKADGKTPRQKLPRCIKVYPFSSHVLNAVGLSGPGLRAVLDMLLSNVPTQPFMISIMCVSENHLLELQDMLALISNFAECCPTDFITQLNLACPNTGEDLTKFYEELKSILDCFQAHELPVVLNFNATVPVKVLQEADAHPACVGFWIGNSIPWGTDGINWKKFSRLSRRIRGRGASSPLRRRGFTDGGLSGPDCLPLTVAKIKAARLAGVTKPIVAGNGIQHLEDINALADVDATAVALGVVGMLRPWRMRKLINHTHNVLG